jgi:putative FmdB family regulatory protein
MPQYAYKCINGHEFDKYLPLKDSDIKIQCPECGKESYKDFSKINLLIDKTLGYYDKQLGAYIGSSSDRRKIMSRKGLIDIKNGEFEQVLSKNDRTAKTSEQKKERYKQIIKESAYKANIPISI